MNKVYPDDTILIADPPSAAVIEGLFEVTAMVRDRIDHKLLGIHHNDSRITMVWEDTIPTPRQSVEVRKLIKLMLPDSPRGLKHVTASVADEGDIRYMVDLRNTLGTGLDVVKHDPRR
jgi:hypothetical protein